MAEGAASFQTNCAACHGRGAQGFIGYPNLNDDEWLWGGTLDEIHKTISFGVRSDHKDARASQMPRFGLDKMLDDAQIGDTAEYVLSLSGASIRPRRCCAEARSCSPRTARAAMATLARACRSRARRT